MSTISKKMLNGETWAFQSNAEACTGWGVELHFFLGFLAAFEPLSCRLFLPGAIIVELYPVASNPRVVLFSWLG
jgi:hypothetical protein